MIAALIGCKIPHCEKKHCWWHSKWYPAVYGAGGCRKVRKMQVKCPTCQQLSAWQDNPWRPFCSERCRLIDLGSWVDEEYRIAGRKNMPQDDCESFVE